jgi:hypothetical protein
MNRREKLLASAIGLMLGLFGLLFVAKGVFLKPLRERDKKIAGVREQLDKVKAERRAYFAHEDAVKTFAKRIFSDQVDQASAKSGEVLTRLILQSGLHESDFSRLPIGPSKPGVTTNTLEIGWSVQGEGKLENVIDLLFLLEESPYLHRIENLVVSTGDSPGEVRAHFRFLTLVMNPVPAEIEFTDLEPKLSLYSPERRLYDDLVTRDILRPYIKRSFHGTPSATPQVPAATPNAPPGPESLRVVSLSEWKGEPEVHVRDLTKEKTFRFKTGDSLAGGTIVMIDYRPLPTPGNEILKSFSRVILRIGAEYWAIERGRTLAEKHRLMPEQLPAELSKL